MKVIRRRHATRVTSRRLVSQLGSLLFHRHKRADDVLYNCFIIYRMLGNVSQRQSEHVYWNYDPGLWSRSRRLGLETVS